MTDQTVSYVQAPNGVHLNPADIAATYTVPPGVWVDMPEARPRARARVADDQPNAQLTITLDGELHYDGHAGIEIDRYEGEAYADVRAEGEARWSGA